MQISKIHAYEVWGPIKGSMEPRDAFQNIYHCQFWSPVNKVLGPNSGNKIFKSIIAIVTLFTYGVLSSCIYIQNSTIIEKIRKKKKKWMDTKINSYPFLDSLWNKMFFRSFFKVLNFVSFVLSIIAQNLN